jgi:hypothetical protein
MMRRFDQWLGAVDRGASGLFVELLGALSRWPKPVELLAVATLFGAAWTSLFLWTAQLGTVDPIPATVLVLLVAVVAAYALLR